ncbi:MAG: hypothetical protein KGN02_09820 [bacterium]|nr:hypothetical protein [bacterium]
MRRIAAVVALLCASAPLFATASVSSSAQLRAVKAAAVPPFAVPIVAASWPQALVAREFVDFTARHPSPYPTTAYLLYDDTNLYVGFHCDQAGVPITASQRVDHAGVGSDDHVSFAIDTAGNGTRTYTFRVNPLGVHDESSSENARYAPTWRSTARVAPDGSYDVMMIVPLADIRAQAAPVQSWRFNFERFVAARNADTTWAYEPAMQSIASVQYWPVLADLHLGAAAARPKPQADLYTLASAGGDHNLFQNGIGTFERTAPRSVGLDVTYPFTNTLAFVGTLAPDFSNVEEDQTTIQPQEFARAYSEYRPFFAEGAQYINAIPQIGDFSGNSMFYTPSIGIFDRGLKIEGTAGRSAIGALNVVGPGVDDDAAGYAYTTPGGDFSLSAQSVIANHDGLHDATTGFGLARLNRRSGEITQLALSTERDPALGVAAHDFNVSEGLRNEHFTFVGYYRDTSAGYAPLDGYTAVNDARGPALVAGYRGTGSSHSPILSYQVNTTFDRYLARDGSVRQADINAFYNVQFKNLISLQGFFGPSELQIAPGTIAWFNRRQLQLGYAEGTPNNALVSYTWGPFAGFYVQQTQAATARVFGRYALDLEYDGNIERTAAGGAIFGSQWLRRAAFSRAFGSSASIGVALRAINGTGGFAQPGTNFSLLYQQRFVNSDLLYVEFGTPAASRTLHRFVVKYVFHAGGGSGT